MGKGSLVWYCRMVVVTLLSSVTVYDGYCGNAEVTILKSVDKSIFDHEQNRVKEFVYEAFIELGVIMLKLVYDEDKLGEKREQEMGIKSEKMDDAGNHGLLWFKGESRDSVYMLLIVDYFEKDLKAVVRDGEMTEMFNMLWNGVERYEQGGEKEDELMKWVWGVVGKYEGVEVGVYFCRRIQIPFSNPGLYETKIILLEDNNNTREPRRRRKLNIGQLKDALQREEEEEEERRRLDPFLSGLVGAVLVGEHIILDFGVQVWLLDHGINVSFATSLSGKREVKGPFIPLTRLILKAMFYALHAFLHTHTSTFNHENVGAVRLQDQLGIYFDNSKWYEKMKE